MKYYNNRYLSDVLGVNLAKWKRWSREFLPPDPLGGLQSGYARQYHPDHAFTVALGGHLVAGLHFSIPEARVVLADLRSWLRKNGYFYHGAKAGNGPVVEGQGNPGDTMVVIEHPDTGTAGFRYSIRVTVSRNRIPSTGAILVEERYRETVLDTSGRLRPDTVPVNSARLLYIGRFLDGFIRALDIDAAHYPALCR